MTMRVVIIIFMAIFMSFQVLSDTLKPFTSDGCSAFPDGTFEQKELWLACCQIHDVDYWQGGTKKQRAASDQRLKMCVEKVDEPTIATLMLLGVRVGGTPYLPTSFRWGYGWEYPRGYGKLTDEELLQVKKLSTTLINNK